MSSIFEKEQQFHSLMFSILSLSRLVSRYFSLSRHTGSLLKADTRGRCKTQKQKRTPSNYVLLLHSSFGRSMKCVVNQTLNHMFAVV